MNDDVRALAVIGTDLYAGGRFTTAGGGSANGIAKWDGTSWSALGSGMSVAVIALAVIGTDLYAGGDFTTAGGKPSIYIGQWHIPGIVGAIGTIPTIPAGYTLGQNYPNPFNPSTKIQYGISEPNIVRINIYNINGELIKELINVEKNIGNYSVTWNGKNDTGALVSSGTYFYQIQVGDFVQAKKMILLK